MVKKQRERQRPMGTRFVRDPLRSSPPSFRPPSLPPARRWGTGGEWAAILILISSVTLWAAVWKRRNGLQAFGMHHPFLLDTEGRGGPKRRQKREMRKRRIKKRGEMSWLKKKRNTRRKPKSVVSFSGLTRSLPPTPYDHKRIEAGSGSGCFHRSCVCSCHV